ncbi:MAG: hypothetical protein ACYCTW_00205 [Sulfuricella sp.]
MKQWNIQFEYTVQSGWGYKILAKHENSVTKELVRLGLSPIRLERHRISLNLPEGHTILHGLEETFLRLVFIIEAENEWESRQQAAKIGDVLQQMEAEHMVQGAMVINQLSSS